MQCRHPQASKMASHHKINQSFPANAERMAVHCLESEWIGKYIPLQPWDLPRAGILHPSKISRSSGFFPNTSLLSAVYGYITALCNQTTAWSKSESVFLLLAMSSSLAFSYNPPEMINGWVIAKSTAQWERFRDFEVGFSQSYITEDHNRNICSPSPSPTARRYDTILGRKALCKRLHRQKSPFQIQSTLWAHWWEAAGRSKFREYSENTQTTPREHIRI